MSSGTKRFIRAIFGLKNNASGLGLRHRKMLLAEKYFGKTPTVLTGPFKGMIYSLNAYGSALLPKILGTYEQPLNKYIENIILNSDIKCIVNVGCAEGYYATGMALRKKKSMIYAFDISQVARNYCRELTELNGVQKNVVIDSRCSHTNLRKLINGKTAILCDIEGGELELLDPHAVPELAECDIIVETHDFIVEGCLAELARRFSDTHLVTVISDTDYAARANSDEIAYALRKISDSEKMLFVDERRPVAMQWLYLESKN